MQNFVQIGYHLDLISPADVVSGEGVAIGDLFGVATGDYKAGVEGVFTVTGVVKLPKLLTDTFKLGGMVYWDGTQVTTNKTAGILAGYYVGDEGNLALVRLPL